MLKCKMPGFCTKSFLSECSFLQYKYACIYLMTVIKEMKERNYVCT